MPPVDDREFRAAALELLRAARRQMPGVDWAAQVVESQRGFFVARTRTDFR